MKPEPPRPNQRGPELAARRNAKIAGSSHAYVRGSTARFYQWLRTARATIPEGPPLWICGDCHLGNLGPVAGADGQVEVMIRDLDQTVIGNPAHDLVRLGLSLASAARSSNLAGVITARMLEHLVDGYQEALVSGGAEAAEEPEVVRRSMRQAIRRRWGHLAQERIGDAKPRIPLGKSFWPLAAKERAALRALVASADVRTLVTTLSSRDPGSEIELVDGAYWVKGCSSLGRLRYALLIGVSWEGERQFALLDVKEAARPDAPRTSGAVMPKDNAKRVVTGASHLSPALGKRMAVAGLMDRPVFVRELLPQDLKLDIGQLSVDEAVKSARYLGEVVGRAHGRQMSTEAQASWASALDRQRPSNLEAPSWLWKSVVELLSIHEAAYLEHCRKYAAGER